MGPDAVVVAPTVATTDATTNATDATNAAAGTATYGFPVYFGGPYFGVDRATGEQLDVRG